jgi:hypothetical protein
MKQVARALLAACLILATCWAYSSTVKIEATGFSETSIDHPKIRLFIDTAVRSSDPTEFPLYI